MDHSIDDSNYGNINAIINDNNNEYNNIWTNSDNNDTYQVGNLEI